MATATLEKTTCHQGVTGPSKTSIAASWAEAIGRHATRYGLVLVLVWIGGMKFTAYEAEGISDLVANSPLMGWSYQLLSTRQLSGLIGFAELFIAALIATRPFSASLSAVGSTLAVGMFLTTLTFLVSTPGVMEPALGFPALSIVPGQFLIKDFVLLGAAVWTAGEALRASHRRTAEHCR